MAALLVRRLEVLLLDLQASLAEHGGALDVAVGNCEVEWVLSFIRLHVQLEVHGSLDEREQDGGEDVEIAPLGRQVYRPDV